MNFDKLEADAKSNATKHVVNMLQRPDQLEKIEQYKRRVSRKKASVESMLKTAMQSQLDGVRAGLNQLQTAIRDVQEIKQNLSWLEDSFTAVPQLASKLQDVREENMRHSQYVTAMENLKHIFTVPESVEKTRLWIQENKFLHAHQSLTDLENSRDDLLYELHKLPNQSPVDTNMLIVYFEQVDNLSQELGKQLRLILSRTLNTVRKEPTVIVTVLRIIEREEKADQFALERKRQSGFLPPGRPKCWKKMAMETLEREVAQRVEGTQVDGRQDNKMWLVRHLELTRQLVIEDLRVVKSLCIPCFPPHYEIWDTFVGMYHNCLSVHLQELIGNGLQGNEYVSLLSWIMNTYSGPELMMHAEINVDTAAMVPLLDNTTVEQLQTQYLKNVERNYSEWMTKTLASDRQDWSQGRIPEGDDRGFYHTVAPVIIFQMIEQNLQVASTISQDLTLKAFKLSMDQVNLYGRSYRDAIIEFKIRHFEDRSLVPYFTHYMITIVNNCLQFVDLAQQTKTHYWRPGMHEPATEQTFEMMINTFQTLRDEAAKFLLEEAFLDLGPHFQDLITSKWLTTTLPVDTICITLEDYFQDYIHLREDNFEYVIKEAINLVAKKFITAMLQKKITFKAYDERKSAAQKILEESKKLKEFFIRIAPNVLNFDSPFDAINMLAEVLKVEDPEILSLDLHGLVDKYPDVTQEHLIQLLALRGDISRSENRETVAHILSTNKGRQTPSKGKSIFSQVTGITTSFF